MKSLFKTVKKGFLLLSVMVFALGGFCLETYAGRYSVSDIDESLKGTIRIEKNIVDSQNGSQKQVEGVKYQITYRTRLDQSTVEPEDADYYQESGITGADGAVEFKNLALGTWLVEEIEGTPEGMEKSESFLVSVPNLNAAEVTLDGVVYEPGSIWEYDITAVPKCQPILGAVRLIKTDAATGKRLKGAVFTLYTEQGEVYRTESKKEVELATNSDGILEVHHLPYGKYYFKEKQAPKGYVLSNETIAFNITYSYKEEDAGSIVEVWAKNIPEEQGQTETNPPANPSKGASNTPANAAKTGDDTNVFYWIALMFFALAAIMTVRKKENRKQA